MTESKHFTPSFFMVLTGDFTKQLAIPENVARNLKKKLGETVYLKGPSGAMWSVRISANNDNLFFNHGWSEFVKNHFLEENDILFFKYNGYSRFDALMFDGGSQCEKESSYFVRKCRRKDHDGGRQTKWKKRESSVEVIPTRSHYGRKGSTTPEKTTHNDINKTPVGQPNVSVASSKRTQRGDFSNKPVHVKQSGRSKELLTFVEEIKAKPEADHTSVNGSEASSPHYASSSRRPVTLDERNYALTLAQAVSTKESITIVMRPSHVYRRFFMAIPIAWLKQYLSLENQDVILRFNEKTWTTRFLFFESRCSGGLSGGWKYFALDNKLNEYDVCVFTPASLTTKPIVLDVSIFRVVNEVISLSDSP